MINVFLFSGYGYGFFNIDSPAYYIILFLMLFCYCNFWEELKWNTLQRPLVFATEQNAGFITHFACTNPNGPNNGPGGNMPNNGQNVVVINGPGGDDEGDAPHVPQVMWMSCVDAINMEVELAYLLYKQKYPDLDHLPLDDANLTGPFLVIQDMIRTLIENHPQASLPGPPGELIMAEYHIILAYKEHLVVTLHLYGDHPRYENPLWKFYRVIRTIVPHAIIGIGVAALLQIGLKSIKRGMSTHDTYDTHDTNDTNDNVN